MNAFAERSPIPDERFTRRYERLHLIAQRKNFVVRRLAEITVIAGLSLLERTGQRARPHQPG
jgi:hypothetical protein